MFQEVLVLETKFNQGKIAFLPQILLQNHLQARMVCQEDTSVNQNYDGSCQMCLLLEYSWM